MNARPKRKHTLSSDLRGVAKLATQATAGVARMVEGVHQSIWDRLGVPGGPQAGQTRGLTGLAYRSVHGVNHLVGRGLDLALSRLEILLAQDTHASIDTDPPKRAAWLAALNGVMGDHLVASHNPLATPMSVRWQGQALDWQQLPQDLPSKGRVLLMIHGLCMNDLQWQGQDGRLDYGQTLAEAMDYCPLYLRYNSGLHTSQNGRELADQLQALIDHWPVPVEEVSIIAHSMGGLLARSACHIAAEQSLSWLPLLKNIVFLGTPHHGAPLERAGNWIDVLLGSTPFTAPLAKLGHLRSAGITDLRHGYVRDEDWSGADRFQRQPDRRLITPLPAGVNCFAVAATLAPKRGRLADRLIGDGLVPLHSALGEHEDPRRDLGFAKSAQWICYRMNHIALLSDAQLGRQLQSWLRAEPSGSAP